MDAAVVRGVRDLSERWARQMSGGSTVLSGLGVWPLLAILATAADEPGRSELADAAGLPADVSADQAGRLVETLGASTDLSAALGVWIRDDLKLAESFDRVVPAMMRGVLTGDARRDKAVLDGWAAEHTDGLIPEMPLEVTPDLVLALASALSLKTTWVKAFEEHPRHVHEGPWAGAWQWLSRSDPDLSAIRLYDDTPAGALVTASVAGDADVDVVLGLGEPGAPARVVVPALLEVDGNGIDGGTLLERNESGTELTPGLSVGTTSARKPDVRVSLPVFEVRAEHDLLAHAELFGLGSVSRPPGATGHFSGISPEPLRVSQAKQTVYARFFATGFEAAAVTAVGMVRMAMMTEPSKRLELELDRPFAFVAVHRASGLPIVAGWIAEPTQPA